MRSIMKYIIPTVLIFAIIGLGYELLFNPLGFLTKILMTLGFIAVIFLGYRWFMNKRYGTPIFSSQTGPSRAQLKRAKRTSTQRQTSVPPTALKKKKVATTQTRKKPIRSSTKRREGHNLTVIEGKKQKKKSRAFF